jgi:hypothetical protein
VEPVAFGAKWAFSPKCLMGFGTQAFIPTNAKEMHVVLGHQANEIPLPRATPQGLKLLKMKRKQFHCSFSQWLRLVSLLLFTALLDYCS